MLFTTDKQAREILTSLKERQEEDFEQQAKRAIYITEAFLSVPPGRWTAKHSRQWETEFNSPNDARWANPVPAPRDGMNALQRKILELYLVTARRSTLEDAVQRALGRISEGDSVEDALRSAGIKRNLTRLAAAFREKFPEQKKPAVQ